jgi:hypothetical protein|tara:strand:- start:8 stop:244 length:237 start_codon:yes stop_codon:yes gene_type:complete
MKAKDIKIGQRVITSPGERIALVVGKPEFYTPRAQLVRIKYENSTRYEYKMNHLLELLPIEQQYEAHGGQHIKPDSDF